MEQWTVGRLRSAMFAEERRKILALHLLLALALSPFPFLLTAWAYLLRIPPMMANGFTAMFLEPMVLFWLSVYLILPILAFLAWSLPNIRLIGLPKRSIVFLCLLAIYNPVRIYIYWAIAEFETRENYSSALYDDIILWDFKNFDTLVLIVLTVWAFRKHRAMRPAERAVFHWLLFVCALWVACDFFDTFVFSFFLLKYAILIFGR